MKPNILFAIAMLAVAPYSLYAQDAAGDDSQAEQRKPAPTRKVYDTRVSVALSWMLPPTGLLSVHL